MNKKVTEQANRNKSCPKKFTYDIFGVDVDE